LKLPEGLKGLEGMKTYPVITRDMNGAKGAEVEVEVEEVQGLLHLVEV
jgi:hypothetical protein